MVMITTSKIDKVVNFVVVFYENNHKKEIMIKTYFDIEENLKEFKSGEEHNIGKVVIGCYRF